MTTTALPYTSNMLNVRELLLGRPAFMSGFLLCYAGLYCCTSKEGEEE